MINKIENIQYTMSHKRAFLKLEKKILGKNTIRGILHDFDKLFLYILFDKKTTSKIHRKFSKHHIENCRNEKDYIQCLIDLECARFTKKDKQQTAYEFAMENYNHKEKIIMINLLKRFKLI